MSITAATDSGSLPCPGMSRRRCVPAIAAGLAPACAPLAAHAARAAGPPGPPFEWLVPTPAPAGWKHVKMLTGAAVFSYPPFLQPAKSGFGAITALHKDAQGRSLVYVNATPGQADEKLATWPAYRLAVLRSTTSKWAHEHGRAVDVPFNGGAGSCVLDDYLTRVGAHHYEEIACYVEGAHGGSVVVATTDASTWPKEKRLLEQVVAAYRAT